MGKISRGARASAALDIRRTGADPVAQPRKTHTHERIIDSRPLAQRNIDLLPDEVDVHVAEPQVQLQARVERMQLGQQRHDQALTQSQGRCQAHQTANFDSAAAQIFGSGIQLLQQRTDLLVVRSAGLGQRDLAGGSMQQACAQFALDGGDRASGLRRRQIQPTRCTSKAALPYHFDKCAQVLSVHWR